MTAETWPRVKALFEEALSQPPPPRVAFLRAIGDGALRAEVERLLALDAEADAYFDTLARDVCGAPDGAAGLPPPERAGPWRLLGGIGRGGMGAVYLAARADGAYEQRAAVKVVEATAPALVQRFLQERQILARLRHPNIARLLGGGVLEDGRPYLAMEHVDGEPITRYCDRRRLGIEARLRLFGQVCEAAAHAHRMLVVHRDLKPSNVFVAEGLPRTRSGDEQGEPQVKLLDFCIARLLEEDGAEAGVPLTRAGARVLTPEYAAPEQIRGEPVTTATDVYALGVLLYELLAGRRPHRAPTRFGLEQAVLAEEPPALSAAVTRGPEGAEEATAEARAAARSADPDGLRRRLRGDLDRICLKALRKEPERRYASADALADDLRRHLDGLPVAARPDTLWYRAGKFVRRHRAGVAAAALGVLSLVGGLGAALWQAAEARAAQARAEEEAATAEAVTDFLVGMVGEARPRGSDGDTLRVRDVLSAGAARLDTGFAERPEIRAALASAFGDAHAELGDAPAAVRLHRLALDLRRAAGPADPGVIEAENDLATALHNTGRLDELDSLLAGVLAARRRHLGPAHPEVVKALVDLGYGTSQRPDSARRSQAGGYFREALAVLEGAGPDAFEAAHRGEATYDDFRSNVYYALATHHLEMEQAEEAAEPMRLALELSSAPPSSATYQMQANTYGVLLRQLGRYEEAISVHREAVDLARAAFGPEHPFYGHPLLSLGSALQASGDAEGAIPVLREAVGVFGGPEGGGYGSLVARFYLGRALLEARQREEGVSVLGKALPLLEEFGPTSPYVTVTQRLLAEQGGGVPPAPARAEREGAR